MLAQLRATHPAELESRMAAYADWGRGTQHLLIQALARDDLLFTEGLERNIDRLRTELEGPTPSPLERLLVERLLCCWLQAHCATALDAVDEHKTLAQAEALQRRQDQTHRRFLQACKALAQVRKLLGPTVQINVADKQINVLGG